MRLQEGTLGGPAKETCPAEERDLVVEKSSSSCCYLLRDVRNINETKKKKKKKLLLNDLATRSTSLVYLGCCRKREITFSKPLIGNCGDIIGWESRQSFSSQETFKNSI